MTAEQFIRWNGRRFVRDPSGRHSFRAVERGQWSPWVTDGKGRIARRDPEGARILQEHGTPVPEHSTPYAASAQATAPPRRNPREGRVEALGKSGVANALEVIGVLGIIVSVIAGIVIVADASSYDPYSSGPDASLGWFVGIAGTVQSLLLLGFAKVLVFTKATAMLLAENLDEVRAG